MHHDLHKFRRSDANTILTQALKLDLTALCPSLHLLYRELADWLVKGELSRFISIQDLRAALSQCCSLCGRSVGAHDTHLHLRHQHPAGLLCRLHHGHRDQHQVQQMWGAQGPGVQPRTTQTPPPTPIARKQTISQAEDLQHIVQTLARLSLRHEDAWPWSRTTCLF